MISSSNHNNPTSTYKKRYSIFEPFEIVSNNFKLRVLCAALWCGVHEQCDGFGDLLGACIHTGYLMECVS